MMQYLLMITFLLSVGCSKSDTDQSTSKGILGYEQSEALLDFDMMVETYRKFYAPMDYKREYIIEGFDFDSEAARLRTELESIALTGDKIETLLKQNPSNRQIVVDKNNQIEGIFKELTALLQDGHVSVSLPKHTGQFLRKKLDMLVLPFLNKEKNTLQAVVVEVGESFEGNGIERGDIILSVDKKDPFEILEIIKKYDHDGDATSLALINHIFQREAYMTDLMEITGDDVAIEWQKGQGRKKGQVRTDRFTWKKEYAETYTAPYLPSLPTQLTLRHSNPAIEAMLGESGFESGGHTPFFFTRKVASLLEKADLAGRDLRAFPPKSTLEKFGLKPESFLQFFAYRYNFGGKKILLIRQPSYFTDAMGEAYWARDWDKMKDIVANSVASFKAVLFDNRDADVLVIDQNYNPGGLVDYVVDFFRIFITEEKNGLISFNNADQKNYILLRDIVEEVEDQAIKELMLQRLAQYETARAKGEKLTPAMPFGLSKKIVKPYDDMQYKDGSGPIWNKPILVLTNSQSGSGGDVFPHLMARNGVAEIFGERTGGWGGNVEAFDLPLSRGRFSVTRGLFNVSNGSTNLADYDQSKFLENHGQPVTVALDKEGRPLAKNPFDRPITIDDFHGGFVDYFLDFSKVAAAMSNNAK